MVEVKLVYPEGEFWTAKAVTIIHGAVRDALDKNGCCSVMLTGGRSAAMLYEVWGSLSEFGQLRNVNFYFGDERIVQRGDAESNYGMVMKTLFQNGIPLGCSIFGIEVDPMQAIESAKSYDDLLPKKIDIMILSAGEDGHIASIFPGDFSIFKSNVRVACVEGPKFPHKRISITPVMLAHCDKIYVLAIGPQKRAVLRHAINSLDDPLDYPAKLVIGSLWISDKPL
jgi:6-phosphogluconolactonase